MTENLEAERQEFRGLLAELKRRLWAELREEVFAQTGEDLGAQYDDPHDPGERSMLDVLADANLAVADIRRQQLTALEEAQRRVEMGTYGICERCGRYIGIERLRLMPFTPHCIDCQREVEGPSKPPGVTL